MFRASFGITHRQTCNRKYTKTAFRSRILKSGLQLSSVIRQLHIATTSNPTHNFLQSVYTASTGFLATGKPSVCIHNSILRYRIRKDYRIGTLRYNWPMYAHASQTFSTLTVPIRKIYLLFSSFHFELCCPFRCRLKERKLPPGRLPPWLSGSMFRLVVGSTPTLWLLFYVFIIFSKVFF